jgi:thiol:disulfide interchange protein
MTVSVIVLVGGYAFAMEKQLDWREPRLASDDKGKPSQVSPNGLAWSKWSPEAVAAAQAAGHPVVVDFTAKWCPNCNIIIKPSLEDASVQSKLKEVNNGGQKRAQAMSFPLGKKAPL